MKKWIAKFLILVCTMNIVVLTDGDFFSGSDHATAGSDAFDELAQSKLVTQANQDISAHQDHCPPVGQEGDCHACHMGHCAFTLATLGTQIFSGLIVQDLLPKKCVRFEETYLSGPIKPPAV